MLSCWICPSHSAIVAMSISPARRSIALVSERVFVPTSAQTHLCRLDPYADSTVMPTLTRKSSHVGPSSSLAGRHQTAPSGKDQQPAPHYPF